MYNINNTLSLVIQFRYDRQANFFRRVVARFIIVSINDKQTLWKKALLLQKYSYAPYLPNQYRYQIRYGEK